VGYKSLKRESLEKERHSGAASVQYYSSMRVGCEDVFCNFRLDISHCINCAFYFLPSLIALVFGHRYNRVALLKDLCSSVQRHKRFVLGEYVGSRINYREGKVVVLCQADYPLVNYGLLLLWR
jgi:hypothetical protein